METSERGPVISQLRAVRPDGPGDHAVTSPTADGLCTEQNNCPYNLGDHEPAFSPDSHQLVYTGIRRTGSGIFTINTDGTGEGRLFADEFDCRFDPISHPSWSPDGHQIVFVRYPDGPTTSDLYLIEASGAGLRRLTTHAPFPEEPSASTHRCTPGGSLGDRPEMNTSPTWTPEETTIVYVTNRYHLKDCSGPEIDSIHPDGTTPTRLTHHNPGPPLPPGCRPDPNDIRDLAPAT